MLQRLVRVYTSPNVKLLEISCRGSIILLFLVFSDTIRDTDSPSILRKFSALIHSSFRTRFTSRRNSEETSGPGSASQSRRASISVPGVSPSHSLLRRATSKTARGSSIIRKDGSIILTKNGKIISVRPDNGTIKREQSFQGYLDTKDRNENNVPKSKSDININKHGGTNAFPHLPRVLLSASSMSSLDHYRAAPTTHSSSSRLYHSSLTKIDSVDEAAETVNVNAGNELKPPKAGVCILPVKSKSSNCVESEIDDDASSKLLDDKMYFDTQDNYLSDTSAGSSQVIINVESDDSIAGSVPLLKKKNNTALKSAKSENGLDHELFSDDQKRAKKSIINISKSCNDMFSVPMLKCPSLEHLDKRGSLVEKLVEKSVSSSPMYKRRWLSNKTIQDDFTKKK